MIGPMSGVRLAVTAGLVDVRDFGRPAAAGRAVIFTAM